MAQRTALVTGGAGFIGSHLVDALIEKGYAVRVLDNLAPPTHDGKLPPWFNPEAEFIRGDTRIKRDWEHALDGVKFVFHLAGYMDMFRDFSTYFTTNVAGTALMYEVIVEKKLPVEKIIAASSQSVYGEGKYFCPEHENIIYPDFRGYESLRNKNWEINCPYDGSNMRPLSEKEDDTLKPISPYGASKVALEHTIFTLGKMYGIPSVALRYSIVQGARQSFRQFYSGALRAYVVAGLAGMPITTHEDGEQLRDFVNVKDAVNAHLAALESNNSDFQAFNVGSGRPVRLRELARTVAKVLGLKPEAARSSGQFRWATARHSLMDVKKLEGLGWKASKTLEDSVREYATWVLNYPEAKKYLDETIAKMKKEEMLFGA
jgi:dTDP-L-rhamnose 4-epimerase